MYQIIHIEGVMEKFINGTKYVELQIKRGVSNRKPSEVKQISRVTQ